MITLGISKKEKTKTKILYVYSYVMFFKNIKKKTKNNTPLYTPPSKVFESFQEISPNVFKSLAILKNFILLLIKRNETKTKPKAKQKKNNHLKPNTEFKRKK